MYTKPIHWGAKIATPVCIAVWQVTNADPPSPGLNVLYLQGSWSQPVKSQVRLSQRVCPILISRRAYRSDDLVESPSEVC
jgi:hypothetical protein